VIHIEEISEIESFGLKLSEYRCQMREKERSNAKFGKFFWSQCMGGLLCQYSGRSWSQKNSHFRLG